MLNITIKSIPHKEQRCYGNIGDYWEENEGRELQVRVSALSDWRYEFLIVIHELIEYYLCKRKGIDELAIQSFDEEWYNQEELGIKHDVTEAGDDPAAPYHWQHVTATAIEHVLAYLLNVDWPTYENEVDAVAVSSATKVPKFEGTAGGPVPHAETT